MADPGDGASAYSPGQSAAFHRLQEARRQIQEQLSQVIVGQSQVIEELLISLFCRGHCLLEGVPGLAKTLMISTLARTLNLTFSRIQFTPDLMPADITGTEIIEENRSTGRASGDFSKARSSRTSSWRTKSTARPPRRRRRCWRPCKSGRSRWAACGTS